MPSATTTLATLGGVIVTTIVSLATVVFTTYWPYFLVFGVLVALVGLGARLLHLGHRK